MKILILGCAMLVAAPAWCASAPNSLAPDEAQAGWQLLWDGKTTTGWQGLSSATFPDHGWEIQDGVLSVLGKKGGDIITTKVFTNFELRAEFRITPGANSGIKYFINPAATQGTGCEYQILDDERHPDAKKGINGNRTIGSLYDLIPARSDKPVKPIGEWNEARIIVQGQHVEHWLNGAKVVEYDRGTPKFREIVAESKFKKVPHFGEAKSGHILLQDHGNLVAFRNLKIKELPAK